MEPSKLMYVLIYALNTVSNDKKERDRETERQKTERKRERENKRRIQTHTVYLCLASPVARRPLKLGQNTHKITVPEEYTCKKYT